jgi:HEAT repeat protein
LALVAIGDKSGLETVAYTLLQGDEGLRRSAAEALANHPEEGHPTLEEGSTLEDTAVRRAAAFGLGRIRQPWATAILEKMHTEDSQWVVQDAATQMLDTIHQPHPRLPIPLPALTHTPWLIAFAGEQGMGVAPGKPAYDLLYLALKQGNEAQRLAATYYLGQNVDASAVLPLYQTYFSSTGELRETAFNALWNLAAAGISLPPPVQYGLK